MIKHSIKYTDFNGAEREEDFYFHLSLPEVTRIEAEIGMSIEDYTRELASRMEIKPLLDFLERIILNAYGRKTTDGRSFHKSKELREEFENSQAYAELFEQFFTTPGLAERFGSGIVDNGKAKKNQVAPNVISN